MGQWAHLPLQAAAGVGLVLLIALTSLGWICYPFLSSDRQRSMLRLLRFLLDWAAHLCSSAPGRVGPHSIQQGS
jgi:hypothetical protein